MTLPRCSAPLGPRSRRGKGTAGPAAALSAPASAVGHSTGRARPLRNATPHRTDTRRTWMKASVDLAGGDQNAEVDVTTERGEFGHVG